MLLSALVLGGFFFSIYIKLEQEFREAHDGLQKGTMMNLNTEGPAAQLEKLLTSGYYYEDPKDVAMITRSVAAGLTTEIENIGELNKKAFNIPAEEAASRGGISFRRRAAVSYRLLGFSGADSSLYEKEKRSPAPLPAVNNLQQGSGSISGKIRNEDGDPVAAVLVRLEFLSQQDSLPTSDISMADPVTVTRPNARWTEIKDADGKTRFASFAAYARTDATGSYQFTGLKEAQGYEIQPLQPGFAFGLSKGTGELEGSEEFDFLRREHTLKLFSGKDFNTLKREKALLVREPGEVRTWFWIILAAFFAGFLLIHLFMSARLKGNDPFILPCVMLLTGISIIILLSLQDPLRDRFLAQSTLFYLLAGLGGFFLMLLFNLKQFTPDSIFYRQFFVKGRKGERGVQWAVAALVLLVATIILGTGPEGSGVKVNLFGFQPSELIKYMLVVFLAGFFTANERFISEYATAGKRWTYFKFALAAVILSILIFLMLGDLGPAIVLCFTFIILFSFSRGDFMVMAGSVALYVLAIWLLDNIWIATGVTLLLLAIYFRFIYKMISESALMAIVVIAGFLLLDQVPLLDKLVPGPMERLTDRKAIWQNNWDNEVYGGDQVANGIWAMASGGLTGQGVGQGFPKTIPEAHTDMILPAIGEEFGWTGIICLFVLFLVYMHRSLLIGRQTGRPFLFYLCAGIGISSFVQFLLIAGGSTGALPLSGISLPFISYGGSSLVLNLIAAGFLVSASFVRGSEVQMKYISAQQDRNLVPTMLAACLGLVLLMINVSNYLFNPSSWVVQPALVADRSGNRMFSYNPRIAILMNKLEAGALYDRNHVLLATSKPEKMLAQKDTLLRAGLTPEELLTLSRKRNRRYYPFAEDMFFWIGDENTGVFKGALNGYFAEYELGAELRGFSTPETAFPVKATRFQPNRFQEEREKDMTVVKRDYSALSSLLLAGINSREVEEFKKQNRDVQLSMDAALQTGLQRMLSLDDSIRNRRVSVVVMEDNTGDVLASASYPLPPVNDWELLTLTNREQSQSASWMTLQDLGFTHATQPGSTAKLATALAALNKHGLPIAQKRFLIRPEDLIRRRGLEPDEAGSINMETGLVRSNNSYFIKLANESRIEEEMATVYLQTGMFLRGLGGYFYTRPLLNEDREQRWRETWRKTEFTSIRRYDPNNIFRTRGLGISGMSWGQGELVATPASIARLAGGIANGGRLVPNRYVLKISDSLLPVQPAVKIAADPAIAALLTDFMKKQSAGKLGQLKIKVAGKTGTPERIFKGHRINDGWYVFFAPKASGPGHIVVCIRIEDTKGSSHAVQLAGQIVIPELLKRGYIKGFEGGGTDSVRRRPVPVNRRTTSDTTRIE